MMTATQTTLAREIAADLTGTAKWYGIAIVAGCIGGALVGLYDYTPPAPSPAPVVTPAAVQPPAQIRPQQNDGGDADLVAQAASPRAVAARRDPMHCIDQVAVDGKLLGQLCQRDPGGVAGSAVGSVQR